MTEEKRAPVQRGGKVDPAYRSNGTVSWDVHLAAWKNYAACGHGSQSAEQIAIRCGFSYREMQCALAGHYNDVPYCKAEHPPIPTWEPVP